MAKPGEFVAEYIVTAADMNALPGGVLGYAQITADQTGITGTVDVTGLTVTVPVVANRRVKVTAYVHSTTSTVATDRGVLTIDADATDVQTQLKRYGGTNAEGGMVVIWVGTPTAASHTYKVEYSVLGSGTHTIRASSASPAFILAEDIGST